MCFLCSMTNTFDPVRHPGEGPLGANITEVGDAAASIATTYSMAVGDVFSGTLSAAGDEDWVAVTLEAGTRYTFSLSGAPGGNGTLSDPLVRLFDASGSQVAFNDDGGTDLDSFLTFTATTSGTYYIAADSYDNAFAGTYALSFDAVEVGTLDELADFLTDGYWESTGRAGRSFDTSVSNQISVNISALTPEGQQLALWAFEAWEMVANIDFVVTTGAAMINFDDNQSGAFANYTTSGSNILSSNVNVSTGWLSSYGTSLDSYSFQTYMHEIGHALGLGHQGAYNGSATYGFDEAFTNDSWQMSLMSYFSQNENTSTTASYGTTMTTMMADILAIQNLYGTPGASSQTAGDTTWGYNSNLGGYLGDFFDLFDGGTGNGNFVGNDVVFTIYGQGGTDTIDLSGSVTNDRIDLREETFSDIFGQTGTLGIARGAEIENLIAGSGNDTITGNDADNTIMGGGGADSILGGFGADSILGGEGDDTIFGGNQFDYLEGGDGRDLLVGDMGNDTLIGGADSDRLTGGNGNDYLEGGLGADLLSGGRGDDTLDGGNRNDRMLSGDGNDVLLGGSGEDLMRAGSQNDYMDGGGGNDTMVAGAGFDTLIGGDGDDVMVGAFNADRFIFADNHGDDVILDFEATNNAEKIDFSGLSSLNSIFDVIGTGSGTAAATQIGSDVLINTGSGTILLENVLYSDLDINDFVF